MEESSLNDLPLISIAMATYNGEKYLREQLDSIYAQTYKNIEVIVTDDCSTDKTIEILEQYSKSHGLKYYINEKNLGFVKNFERAVSLCQGKYIALSDQDDIWLSEKLEKMYANIGNNSLICSDAFLINMYGVRYENSFIRYAKLLPEDKDKFSMLLYSNYVVGCMTLLRRDLLKKAHPIPDGVQYHDWWYAIVATKLEGICYYDEALILYRQHEMNHTGANQRFLLGKRMLSFINKKLYIKKIEERKKNIERLKAYLNSSYFTKQQEDMITTAIEYYEDRCQGIFHFKAFYIALKNKEIIFGNESKMMRYLLSFNAFIL